MTEDWPSDFDLLCKKSIFFSVDVSQFNTTNTHRRLMPPTIIITKYDVRCCIYCIWIRDWTRPVWLTSFGSPLQSVKSRKSTNGSSSVFRTSDWVQSLITKLKRRHHSSKFSLNWTEPNPWKISNCPPLPKIWVVSSDPAGPGVMLMSRLSSSSPGLDTAYRLWKIKPRAYVLSARPKFHLQSRRTELWQLTTCTSINNQK